MNYLDGYVEEVLSEPYYDDYGSGIFRWWVKVSYVCEGNYKRGIYPHPYLKSSSHDFCLQDSNN